MCLLKDAAADAPSTTAVGTTSYRELDAIADRHARRLLDLGVRSGDRVAFLLPPSPESAALFFAAWRIGASICPLSPRTPQPLIESLLARLDAAAYVDESGASARSTRFPQIQPPSALLFTSGSTSLPKIAVLSLESLIANAIPALDWFNLRPNDRWLLNLPLCHVAGIGILLRCILAKAAAVLDPSDPGITHVSAVPTQLYRATPVYPRLRCLLIGGAPIPSYPQKLPCFLTYGLTETGSLVAAKRNPPKIDDAYPLGFPLPHREIRLAPDGEILVRGDCLFQGYWKEGCIEKPFDADGWFATKDTGRISSEGLSILGRKDWQFISGGENIQPEEIENALLSLPGVLEAVVVPRDHPEFGKRPIALVRSLHSDEALLKTRLLDALPKFKIPDRIVFVHELPKTGLKINRKAIFEMDINKTFNLHAFSSSQSS